MMGRTHALTGLVAGLAAAPLVGADTAHTAVAFAAVTAGFALLPDLDHPGASASRLLGPLTGGLSRLLRGASAVSYRLTKGRRDEHGAGTHRHLTHTVAFAAALGGLTAWATHTGGPWAVAGVALFALLLAESVLGDWLLPVTGGAVTWWAASSPYGVLELAPLAGWLGIAVALGCVAHCLGDAITLSGCPFLWPLPIAGETWYEIRPPRWLRIRTGAIAETWLIFPAFAVAAVLLMPGATDLIARLTSR